MFINSSLLMHSENYHADDSLSAQNEKWDAQKFRALLFKVNIQIFNFLNMYKQKICTKLHFVKFKTFPSSFFFLKNLINFFTRSLCHSNYSYAQKSFHVSLWFLACENEWTTMLSVRKAIYFHDIFSSWRKCAKCSLLYT